MVLAEYRRKALLLGFYRTCVPKVEDMEKRLKDRAKELDLGEGHDVTEFLAGLIAGGALTLTGAGGTVSAVGSTAASLLAHEGLQGVDLDKKSKEFTEILTPRN